MKFFIYALAIAIFLGIFPSIHPLFDSLTHFRIHFLVSLLVLLVILSFFAKAKERYFTIFAILSIAIYLYITLTNRPQTKVCDKTMKMMQYNLRFDNENMIKVQTFLLENPIDIATFQEVTYAHKAKLEELKQEYPYQAYCEFATVGGEMIISKHPFTKNGGCVKGEGLVWREIDVNNKKFSLVSLHLHWPYPLNQFEQISTLSKELEKIKGSVIVAGDFNAVPWSHSVARVENASHTKAIDGIRWSIKVGYIDLPIDHVLISDDFKISDIAVGEELGSDHLPIMTNFCME
jgi:endonuclease/exonuclease/phosphatase (EEP) superfamily protein YafD